MTTTVHQPRDHHFAPVFYLQRWAVKNGKMAKYSNPWDRFVIDWTSPKSTGFEPDLYSLRNIPEDKLQWVETEFFAKTIDTPASRVASKLCSSSTRRLSDPEKSDWTRFLLSLRSRSPNVVETIRKTAPHVLQHELARNPEDFERVRGDLLEDDL